MQLIDNIPVWGSPVDPGAMSQIRTCARTADHVALMADHHKGYAVPIGGVVAYREAISPSGVGFDSACGNKAVRVDAPAAKEWVRRAGVELRGAGLDESPHCYKRLPGVLAEHSDTIRVLHTLTPIGVAMAGPETHDPYKD